MVVGTFPLVKLGVLLVRQISKPVAGYLKGRAKKSVVFRNYVCLPTAHMYHWVDMRYRMFLMGFGKPAKVTPLNEEMAIELGADILSEFFIFGTAALALTLEYVRSSVKSRAKEEAEQQRIVNMESKILELELMQEQLRAQLRQFERHSHSSPLQALKEKFVPSSSSSKDDQKPVPPAPGPSVAPESPRADAQRPQGTVRTPQFRTLPALASNPDPVRDDHAYRSKMIRRALKILMDAYEDIEDDD